MSDEITRTWELVWGWRAEVDQIYPTTDTVTSLRFAFTEAGEAMDAWIRRYGPPNLKRNTQRDDEVWDELADCAFMLMTAMYSAPFMKRAAPSPWGAPIDEICSWVSAALTHYVRDPSGTQWETFANYALIHIKNYPGMDLYNRVAGRLQRIQERHVEEMK